MADNMKLHIPPPDAAAVKAVPPPAQSPDGLFTHLRISVVAVLATAILVCGIYPLIVWGLSQAIFPHKANGSLIRDNAGQVIASELLGQNFTASGYFHPRPSLNGYDPTNTGGTNLGPTSKKLINGTIKQVTLPATQPGGQPVATTQADFPGIKLGVLLYVVENNIPFTLSRQQVDASGNVKRDASGTPLMTPADAADFKTPAGDWDQVKLINAFNDNSAPLMIQPSRPIPADAVTWSASGLDPHISPANARIQLARIAAVRKAPVPAVEKLVQENTEGPDLGFLGDAGVNVVKLNLALDREFPLAPAPTTAP